MSLSKRFKSDDVAKVYRKTFSIKIPWNVILDEEILGYMNLWCNAKNCNLDLVMTSLLSLVASMSGPRSTVSTRDRGFCTPISVYLISVMDPGGGKSNVFSRVIKPALDEFHILHGYPLGIETYTTAGLQRHQQESEGYGLLTSDEGNKIFTQIRQKELKGDSEMSLLCKMWSGAGDSSTLSSGCRGFNKTGLSLYVAIQPENFMKHLLSWNSGDGFVDRFMVFSCKPTMVFSEIMAHEEAILQTKSVKDFTGMLKCVYMLAKSEERRYMLSKEAQRYYDEMFDSYVAYVHRKYGSDDDSDYEEASDLMLPSGKDTIHVLRLACVLHIFEGCMLSCLSDITDFSPPLEISMSTLQRAHKLFNVSKQHKSMYVESLSGLENEKLALKKVKSLQERVVAAIFRMDGPALWIRDLNKRLKNVLVGELRQQLEELEDQDFGALHSITRKKSVSYLFFKPAPESLNADNKFLKMNSLSIEGYSEKFNVVRGLNDLTEKLIMDYHPHREAMTNLLTPRSTSGRSDSD